MDDLNVWKMLLARNANPEDLAGLSDPEIVAQNSAIPINLPGSNRALIPAALSRSSSTPIKLPGVTNVQPVARKPVPKKGVPKPAAPTQPVAQPSVTEQPSVDAPFTLEEMKHLERVRSGGALLSDKTPPGLIPKLLSRLDKETRTVTPEMMDAKTFQDAWASSSALPEVASAKQGIDSLQKMVADMGAKERPIDWSPLFSGLDVLSGRHGVVSKSYRAPSSERLSDMDKIKMAEQIQKQRTDLVGKVNDTIKSRKGGITTELLKSFIDAGYGPKPIPPNQRPSGITDPGQNLFKIQRAFNQEANPVRQRLDAADSAERLVASGNPIAPEAIKVIANRLIGDVGNVSESERASMGGSQAAIDRINRFVSKVSDGTLDAKDRRDFLQLASMFKRSAQASMSNIADKHATQGAAAFRAIGLTKEGIKSSFGIDQYTSGPAFVDDGGKSSAVEAAKKILGDPSSDPRMVEKAKAVLQKAGVK